MYEKDIELRDEDVKILGGIYRAMGQQALLDAKTEFGEKAGKHKDGRTHRPGYGKNWCGSYAYEYAKSIRRKDTENFNTMLPDYGFANIRSFQNLATQQSDKYRAEQLFRLLSDFQSISLADCLHDFLVFCKKRRFNLDVLKIDSFIVDDTIADIKAYLQKESRKILAAQSPSKSDISYEVASVEGQLFIRESQGGRELVIPDFQDSLDPNNIASLLSWEFQLTEFVGRKTELNQLHEWLDKDADRSIQVIHGNGGVGKTRCAYHFAEQILELGWSAGTDDGRLVGNWISGQKGILLIIDYPEERLEEITQIVRALKKMSPPKKKIRILLLSRNVSYISDIFNEMAGIFEPPILLKQFDDPTEQWSLMKSSWDKLQALDNSGRTAEHSYREIPFNKADFEQWVSYDPVHSNPLILTALIVYFNSIDEQVTPSIFDLRAPDVIRFISLREEKIIRDEVKQLNKRNDVPVKVEYQGVLLTKAISAISGGITDCKLRQIILSTKNFDVDSPPRRPSC